MRIGHGYDIHRLVPGRPLLLGGIEIESPVGLLGHSDGDVVLHAVCDALLGAAGLGDIGEHFPDNDERYHGADSSVLLANVLRLLDVRGGWQVNNVDITIHAERPRLSLHRDAIRARIAKLLGIEVGLANIKAKTNEGLDAIGKGEAIAATAVVIIEVR